MNGEFLCEGTTGLSKGGVGGGNLLIMGKSATATLQAAEAAVKAIRAVPDVIMPFPADRARSGSKVGSNTRRCAPGPTMPICPTLRGAVTSALDPDVACVLEIVIDGLSPQAVASRPCGPDWRRCCGAARRVAWCASAPAIMAALGPHHFHLKELLQ